MIFKHYNLSLPFVFLFLLCAIYTSCSSRKTDNNYYKTLYNQDLKISECIFNSLKGDYDTIVTFVFMGKPENQFANQFNLKIIQPGYPRYMEIRDSFLLQSNALTNFNIDTTLLPQDSLAYSEKLKQIAPMLFFYGPYANYSKKSEKSNIVITPYGKSVVTKFTDSLNTIIWNYKRRRHTITIQQDNAMQDSALWRAIVYSFYKNRKDEQLRLHSIHSKIQLKDLFRHTTLLVFSTQGCVQEPSYYQEIAGLKRNFKHHLLDVTVFSNDAEYNLKPLNKKYKNKVHFQTDTLKLNRFWGIEQIPAFIIIDKNGNFVSKIYEPNYSIEAIKAEIEKALISNN